MRHRAKALSVILIIGVVFAASWLVRVPTLRSASRSSIGTSIRDFLYQAKQPKLPVAEGFQFTTSTVPTLTPSSRILPKQINLAVPFLLQAPTHNWNQPYQDACEEAAAIMVDAYYHGRKNRFHEVDGNKAVLDIIAFEKKLLGKYEDTTAEETAHLIREYFHYQNVIVQEVTSTRAFKPILVKGYPVIVPAYGKALGNPYFRNGGPVYHMLVIKGYLADGRWIVNDAGVGVGADYIYRDKVLWNVMHDWNYGDVIHGKKMMIVVMPKIVSSSNSSQ